jgi:ABC-type polysaccharide/polyol phosphate export permease
MNSNIRQRFYTINALIYRDYRIRFNNSKFSFIGTLINPIGLVLIFLLIFGYIRVRSNPYMDQSLFLTIGIIQYGLFNEIAIRSTNLMQVYQPFFNYRVIQPLDLMFSRTIVGIAIQLIILLLLLFSIFFIKGKLVLENIPLLTLSFFSLSLFCCGLGMILFTIGYKNKFIAEKIIPIFFRPLFLLSGTIFSLYSIPQKFHKFFTWNPIFQANELSRHALDSNYYLYDGISITYLIYCSLFIFILGLITYFINLKTLKSKDNS